jgi:hypothetical protein
LLIAYSRNCRDAGNRTSVWLRDESHRYPLDWDTA